MFASSTFQSDNGRPFWNLLSRYGADVVVTAHARLYERFAPSDGIREFVVGTAGAEPQPSSPTAPNSEALNRMVYGALKLDLHRDGYDWKFLPVAGTTFTDSGHGSC